MANDNLNTLRQSLENAHSALLDIAKGRSADDFQGEFDAKSGPAGSGSRVKSVSTTALVTGGALDAEQSDRLERYIRGTSDIMDAADVQVVTNPKGEIDNIYLTNMITQKATESTPLGETANVLLGDDEYETVETYAAIDVTHKVLTRNIEKERFADTIIDMVVKAVANDYSFMALNGDTSSTDLALKCWDGYKLQAEKGRVVSAGGASVSYDIFAGANDEFDDNKRRYLGKNLRWMGHSRLWANWDRELTTRVGTLSDSVLGGANTANPLGIAPLICDEIPTNLAVSETAAQPCVVLCTIHGPFGIVTGANKINLDINGAGATVYTIPVGTYLPAQFAHTLNALLVADGKPAITKVDQMGRIYFQTSNTGVAATIAVAADAAELNDVIGVTDGAYTGQDASASNSSYNGTYLMLTDPKNFWFGVLNSLRIYWEYKPRGNKWELTVFSEGIPYLRDSEAIVTVEGIKLNRHLS